MFTYARLRGRLAALVAVAVAATTIAATAPTAWAADVVAPRLDSITFTSPSDVRPGDPVTISYAVTDDSPTVSIAASFMDANGRRTEWDFGDRLPLTGVASTSVPDGLANTPTKLMVLTVSDVAGNRTEYWTNAVSCTPDCPGATHSLSFAVTLSVTGSTPDTDVPLVTSVALASPTTAVGAEARLDLGISEPHPPVASLDQVASALFTNGRFTFRLTGHPSAYGTLTGVVPTSVPNGPYWIDDVVVRDLAGNSASYTARGTVAVRPQGSAVGPATHTLPLTSTTITVTGSAVDVEAPVLSRLVYSKRPTTAGSIGSLSYTVTDDALESVMIYYRADGYQTPSVWGLETTLTRTGTSTGTATGRVPSVGSGPWRTESVVLRDRAGHYSSYQREGSLYCSTSCPSTHSVDLAALDLEVIAPPEAPSYLGVTPLDRSARVQWDLPTDVGNSAITGYTVTVSPGGRTFVVKGARSLTVPGLTNHIAYTFSVRARNAAGLGQARAAKATPRPRQRLFMTVDVSNDSRADIIGVTAGHNAWIYRGNGAGGILGSARVATGLGDVRVLLPALAKPTDDFFGGNVLSVPYADWDESWWAYNGNRLVPFNSLLSARFNAYRHVVTPGDFTGNAKADVLSVADNGDMFLWANKDWTHLYAPKKIGSGLQSFTSIIGVGDLDGDRSNDLVGRRSDGTLWLFAGSGTGGFRYRKQIGAGRGWNGFAQLAGMGDFTGDRRNDLLALAPNGYLYVYKGDGKGGFPSRVLVSKGFGAFV